MARRSHAVVSQVLPNGLKVIVEPLRDFSSVAVGAWVLTGSRDEAPAQAGISHLIEHLAFKGTATRSARQIALQIDSLGGSVNAYTSKEYTSFYAKVLGDAMPQAMDILGDIILRSLFTEADLLKEREVVLQEISMVEDTPDDLVHDLHCREFWAGQSIGSPILGTAQSLGALRSPDVRSFHSERYRAEGMLLTAAGDVDPDRLAAQAEACFAGLEAGPSPQPRPRPRPTPRVFVQTRPVEQAHFCLGFDGLAAADDRRYALLLLNTILGGGMSSRLFQKVREEHGLAYSVYSYHSAYADAGLLTVYCGTSPDEFPRALALILEEVDRIAQDLVPDEEMATSRQQLKGNLLLGLESTTNRMNQLARNEICFGRQVPTHEITEGIDSATTEDVRALAAELLDRSRLALTVIGPVPEARVLELAAP